MSTNFSLCNQESKLSTTPIIASQYYDLLMAILGGPLLLLTLMGIITNTLNLLVFVRQGVMSDSTTVTLFTLTITEIVSCIFLLPQGLCFYLENLVQTENVLIRNCFVLSTMSASYPHLLCSQIICWVTVYISLERALCVLFPLQVKSLVKSGNTALVLIFIFVSEFVFHIPFIINSPILWLADEGNNKSFIAINYQTPDGSLLYRINNLVESTILTTAAMVIVTISTVIMIARLKLASIWRANAAGTSAESKSVSGVSHGSKKRSVAVTPKSKNRMSTKDKEVVKMVASVTTVFVTCIMCGHIPGLTMYMIPGFSIDGYNRDLFQLFYTLTFFLDVINANVNFFFYLKMSSKFRKTFYSLWSTSNKNKQSK